MNNYDYILTKRVSSDNRVFGSGASDPATEWLYSK